MEEKIKKILTALLAGAVLALLFLAFFTNSSEVKEKVRVADLAVTQNAPFYFALENGFFTHEGIEVEIVRFDSPKQIVDAVALNQVDLSGPGGATGIAAIAESIIPGNLKYYAFSCHFNETGTSLLVLPGSEIASLKDLVGKKVGKLPGIQWTAIARRMLENNGINASKVELVDLAIPLQLQALEAKQVDALIALDPVGEIGVGKGIAKVAVAGVAQKNVVDPLCGGAGLISAKFLKERPAVAKKVLTAMKKAFNEFRKQPHPEILVKYLKLDEKTARAMPFPLQEFAFYDELSEKQKQATQRLLDLFYEEGVMKKKVRLEDILLN